MRQKDFRLYQMYGPPARQICFEQIQLHGTQMMCVGTRRQPSVYSFPVSICCRPQIPLENKSIFSGQLFQYLEENKKWKNRFFYVPDTYNINCYDNKAVRGSHHCTASLVNASLIHSVRVIQVDSSPCALIEPRDAKY